MAEEKSPAYGLSSIGIKDEALHFEEESAPAQIVYRCPHKRGEGGRCNVTYVTDLNLLLNHFYKHHARERLLTKSKPKFAMCCFRDRCPAKFQNHKELVEHMWEHDNDPIENIYFAEYIKDLYEKESQDLVHEVKESSREIKDLKEEVEKLKVENNMLQADNVKIKETMELTIQNKNLELQLKAKDLRKEEIEIKKLKEDKKYYKDKYHSESKKNEEYKTEIEYNETTIEKQNEKIINIEEKKTNLTIKLNLRDDKIKEFEAIIANTPSSTSTDTNDNLRNMKKEIQEKDKKIKEMKKNVKILKKEVKTLNTQNMNLKLKKSYSSSDSDENESNSDGMEDDKKSNKKEKLDKKGNSQHSSDESSDSEERRRQKKKRRKNCSQSVEEEYVEKY